MSGDHSVEAYRLLWSPAFEQAAQAEGWQLRPIMQGQVVEVDFWPTPDVQRDGPLYSDLSGWLVLNAYVLGSALHRIAWEFEYDTNREIYDIGKVPGAVSDELYRSDNDGWRR